MKFSIVAGLVVAMCLMAGPAYARPDNGPVPPKDTRPPDTVVKKWYKINYTCLSCTAAEFWVVLLSGNRFKTLPWDYRLCDVGERWSQCATYPYNKIKEKAKV